jgi:hypothetical protein
MAARFEELFPHICADSKDENPEFAVRVCVRVYLRARGEVLICVHGVPAILKRIDP